MHRSSRHQKTRRIAFLQTKDLRHAKRKAPWANNFQPAEDGFIATYVVTNTWGAIEDQQEGTK